MSQIKPYSRQLGVEYLRVQWCWCCSEAGRQLKARRDQLAERSGISYSDHAKCQQDNLIICDPQGEEKIKRGYMQDL